MQLFETKYQGSVLNNPMKFHNVNHFQKTIYQFKYSFAPYLVDLCHKKMAPKATDPSFKKMTVELRTEKQRGVHRVQLPGDKDGFQSLPSLTIKRISNDHPWWCLKTYKNP